MARSGWCSDYAALPFFFLMDSPHERLRTIDLPPRIQQAGTASDSESEAGLAERLAQYEHRIIADVLEQEQHNRTRTAARLGITRKTLLSKITTYGLAKTCD